MIPLIAGMAAGGALQAGVKGVQNLVNAQDQEEQAKKQALQALSQKFQASTGGQQFSPPPKIEKAPSFGEAVVAPMAQAAAGSAMNAGLSALGKPSAPSAPPMSDPHSQYQKDFAGSMAPPAPRPAVMPGQDEQDFYTSEQAREAARRRLVGGR